jgi:DNA-binding transcriptional LysR family regulator
VDAPLGPKDAINSAVANGLGLGFVSKQYAAAEAAAGRLAILNVPELQLKIHFHIVVHNWSSDSSTIRAFADFLQFREP